MTCEHRPDKVADWLRSGTVGGNEWIRNWPGSTLFPVRYARTIGRG